MEQPIPQGKPNFNPHQAVLLLMMLGGLLLSAVTGATGYYLGKNKVPGVTGVPQGVACTMEAKICPDGSSVGRLPPRCEFAPCPATQSSSSSSVPLNTLPSSESETVDFAACKTGDGYNRAVGFGSTSLEILEDRGDTCTIRTKNEVEGSYTIYQCTVPQVVGKVTFNISDTGSDFSSIEKYCNSKAKGNINFGN